MTAPKRFGGYEADFMTQCEVLAEVARGCGSTSWVATIFSAMSWLVGVFPDEAQEEIFDSRDPRISGVFSPTGKAVRTSGGFVVERPLGLQHRRPRLELDGRQRRRAERGRRGLPTCMLVRSRELQRLDDWHASGMAATGSNTIVAKDMFVPAHRTCRCRR